MAEPLKNFFNAQTVDQISQMLAKWGGVDLARFQDLANDGLTDLELLDRARHVEAALTAVVPGEPCSLIAALPGLLGEELDPSSDDDLGHMAAFVYLPFAYYISDHGLDCFAESMTAQYELTKRFTAEFSIRRFLIAEQDRTLAVLAGWVTDDNVHVRRLVSEGTRSRLPWAPRIPTFVADPAPVIALLDRLVGDESEYVRRSVANNLNDISKDHPELAVSVAERWLAQNPDDPNRYRLVRHGLRTLTKAGDAGALAVLGFVASPDLTVTDLRIDPASPTVGDSAVVEFAVSNNGQTTIPVLVDLQVEYARPGKSGKKVFRARTTELAPGQCEAVRKRLSFRQHSTRAHYPGAHAVVVQVNGEPVADLSFILN